MKAGTAFLEQFFHFHSENVRVLNIQKKSARRIPNASGELFILKMRMNLMKLKNSS